MNTVLTLPPVPVETSPALNTVEVAESNRGGAALPWRIKKGVIRGRGMSVEQRFWEKVNKDGKNGCWEWLGGVAVAGGYGMFNEGNSKVIKAHRFSFRLAHGSLPETGMICHHCDNPICVNPEHLYAGNAATNAIDKSVRKRTKTAKLTEEQVVEAKNLFSSGVSFLKISRKFSVTSKTVADAVTGYRWAHVISGFDAEKLRLRIEKRTWNCIASKFSPAVIDEIKSKQDMGTFALSKQYKTNQDCIYKILQGKA